MVYLTPQPYLSQFRAWGKKKKEGRGSRGRMRERRKRKRSLHSSRLIFKLSPPHYDYIVWTDDHRLLQESNLTMRQRRRTSITFYIWFKKRLHLAKEGLVREKQTDRHRDRELTDLVVWHFGWYLKFWMYASNRVEPWPLTHSWDFSNCLQFSKLSYHNHQQTVLALHLYLRNVWQWATITAWCSAVNR